MGSTSHPSVAAYHRNLSAHLLNLLQTTTTPEQRLQTVAETSGPPNPASGSDLTLSKVFSATSSDQLIQPISREPEEVTDEAHLTARPLSQPPILGSQPESSRSTEASIPTPPDIPSTREDEHQAAWRSDGAKIYKTVPEGFNLVLDMARTKSRSGSNESQPHGLGINLAVTPDQALALRMGLKPIHPEPTARKMASCGNLSVVSTAASASQNVISVSSLATSNPTPIPSSSRPSREITSTQLRDPTQEEKDEEYELRRQMRLRKKDAELRRKIAMWRDNVVIVDDSVPEIEPTPPTPSIGSSQLRLSPFHPEAISLGSISDKNGRLRAIDALLGDMSLRQTTSPLGHSPFPLKPLGVLASDSPNDQHQLTKIQIRPSVQQFVPPLSYV